MSQSSQARTHTIIPCVLVGCGYWGHKVLAALLESSGKDLSIMQPFTASQQASLHSAHFKLMGFYDSNPHAMRSITALYHSIKTSKRIAPTCYESYEAVLNDSKIQAIFIITPPHSHAPLARLALLAYKHVFVEKPLSLYAHEGEELYTLARKQGCVLHCDHIFLYAPAIQWLYAQKSALGNICSINSFRMAWGRFQRDVGVLWDLVLHDVAILHYLFASDMSLQSIYPMYHKGELAHINLTLTLHAASHSTHTYISNVCAPSHIHPCTNTHIDASSLHAINPNSSTPIITHITSSWLYPSKQRTMLFLSDTLSALYDEANPHPLIIYQSNDKQTSLHTLPPHSHSPSASPYASFTAPLAITPHLSSTPPLLASIADFYTQILQGHSHSALASHTISVLKIIEKLARTLHSPSDI